ncbi:TonB-dependent receptor [uncultured Chitinophaga sp.]|uniref:SusC/RagA family TonB-linked outer membrane protein n=1 Tax=uncultured Chitinophaga sp. TaxID=339340 RepID=UPI0025D2B8EF|nr:TonB-dependent receptor [uncultured Chitinophaga sp.]
MKKNNISRISSEYARWLRLCCTLLLLIAGSMHVHAFQTVNILVKGKVTDDQNQPLLGATLRVKGGTTGGSTDASGRFSFSVPENSVIEITFMGYDTRQFIAKKDVDVNIRMEPSDQSLEGVVVVGYGTQKKASLTGAVDQVSAKMLENRPITRLSQGLQGVVAGLNITTNTGGGAPAATQGINVRGFTGMGSTGSPLVVIDGVQGGDINSINPADVESISVIKDAASAAIYGSSAPYGVILITTKKGKAGSAPAVTYNNVLSWAQPINLPKMLNSVEFAEMYNQAYANAGRGAAFTDETIQRMKDYQSGKINTETVTAANGSDTWGSWFEGNANHDWFKVYFKDFSPSQQHNLGISGGGNKSNYYVGMGYNDRQGMYNFGDDSYKRYNIRANVDAAVTNWMSVGFRTSLARALGNTPNTYSGKTGGNYMHQIARKFPNVALFNPDGGYSDPSDVLLHQGGRSKSTRNDAVVTGEISIKPLKGWNITGNFTFDGIYSDASNHTKILYTTAPSGALLPVSGTSPNSFSRSSTKTEHTILNLYSSYEKAFGAHNFKILGGLMRELTDYTTFSAGNNSLYSDNIPSLNTTFGTAPSIGDQMRQLAIQGYFGRFNYNYKDKYLLEVSGRYDGTSRFLSDYRMKFYPGASAGWNLDRESFWAPLASTVNRFKIRANYGSLGDQGFLGDPSVGTYYPFYPSLGTAAPTSNSWLFGGTQQASVSMPGLVNTALTWVTTTSYGVGVDAGLLKDKLSLSFDYYVRRADDFSGPAMVLPGVLGAGVPAANNAGMETRGFELTAMWRDQIGDVSYSVRGVLSDYKGKVTKYNNATRSLDNWYVGEVMGNIWGYSSDGLLSDANAKDAIPAVFWTGRWQAGDVRYADLDKSGRIDYGKWTADSSGDYRVIGNSTPRYAYSFTFDVGWKGFDLSMFMQGIGKRDYGFGSGSNYFWGIMSSEWQSSPFSVHRDTWSPEKTSGYFPRIYMNSEVDKNHQVQTRYLQNASYLRIKNLQLGYTLPERIAGKAFMKKLRVYGAVENLATFTKLIKTMDPELSLGDAKIYPLQRTYTCGVNVTF